jgi:superfamily I DNA/RNA helicase
VPFRQSQTRIAEALTARGLEAVVVDGDKLDLAAPGVKLVTLKSAKGLEFPIVAVAGFLDGDYPVLAPGLTPADEAMTLGEERRSLYVAMTRAMHALLVLVPEGAQTPLLRGFDPQLWNVGQEAPAPRASGTRPSVRPAPGIAKTRGRDADRGKRRGAGG